MTNAAAEEAMRRADALEDANDIDAAIQALSEAIDLAPESAKYWRLRGRLFALQKQWLEAIRDFDNSIAIQPVAPTTLFGRGRARAMIDDLDGAIADFERCVELQPTAADALTYLGSIRYYRGELQQALEAYHRAVELEPDRQSQVAGMHIAEIEQKLRACNHPKPKPDPKRG